MRLDLLVSLSNTSLYILELPVGYESNLRSNADRKQLKNDYEKVKFINLSLSALGIYDKTTTEFIDMMKMLKFDKRTTNYTIKKITNIAIGTSYSVAARQWGMLGNAPPKENVEMTFLHSN